SRRTSLPQGRQRLETHLARADAEPVDDFLVERDPVGAAMLDLFGLREPGIEDALLARRWRRRAQGLEHPVHRVLQDLRVAECLDVVRGEVVLRAAAG